MPRSPRIEDRDALKGVAAPRRCLGVNRCRPAILSTLLPAAVSLVSGCVPRRVPLTAELRQQYALGDEELQNLQLYVSHDVRLRREIETRRRVIDGGELKLHGGRSVDEVVIERGTPCVVETASMSRVAVSCDEGSTLSFVLPSSSGAVYREPLAILPRPFAEPPPDDDARRAVAITVEPAAAASGSYVLELGSDGTVRFRGLDYQAIGESAFAQLLIDAEELDEVAESRSVLRGRRVPH